MYRFFFKRVIDIVVSSFLLVLLSPILLLLTIGLYIANDGKPFFFQVRPGLNGKLFSIIKYKTMNDKRGEDGELLPDFSRLTSLGSIIRKSSLDELPQLLNVIKGNMSLVGPRPLLPEYLELYSEEQSMRHSVRPGITGWAQVNGRNEINWQVKFDLDVWYVRNLSFGVDCSIILRTVKKVFVREGISEIGHVTIRKFKGNEE